jgi:hypothetical protein
VSGRSAARAVVACTAALLGVVTLTGCADTTIRTVDSTWLVTNIYTSPDEDNVVSNLVVTQPSITFGQRSVTGTTGCTQFQGFVTYTDNGGSADIDDADHITFTELVVDSLPDDCQGQERLIHQTLVDLLPGTFELNRRSDSEILLVADVDDIDRPSIRLVSWVAPR